ncbi:MAG: lipocalin family protein [Chitinophagaceae bacterium]
MKKSLIAFAAICCLFTACKKSDSGGSSLSGTAALTNGKWKLTAATTSITVPGIPTQNMDIYGSMQACEKDNLLTFNANNTVTMDEGATKCDPSDPQTADAGTWTLSADNKTLTATATSGGSDVATLDGNTLALQTTTSAGGGTSTVKYTYSHP